MKLVQENNQVPCVDDLRGYSFHPNDWKMNIQNHAITRVPMSEISRTKRNAKQQKVNKKEKRQKTKNL